ncbi:ficolin-1-B-like [Mytilus californianus]|uniref:ficolin-1-B-like n=1 Tax=Mytilus californianus TaxID=6549 RepID=UPI002246DC0E|nr:ficolin-1-B-like [Mytilus californianus]
MDTAGFGWTVFQSRMNGAKDFYRGWIDYENGFGDLMSEFWLGNNFIHLLTSTGNYKLYIHLEDFEGNSAYAEYFEFILGDSATNYRLKVEGYCGTADKLRAIDGDSLEWHNGMTFSTKDNDNDRKEFSCAQMHKGAWWYTGCHTSNLNGEYLGGNHSNYGNGVI